MVYIYQSQSPNSFHYPLPPALVSICLFSTSESLSDQLLKYQDQTLRSLGTPTWGEGWRQGPQPAV